MLQSTAAALRCCALQEAVKINQGTGIWVEDCDFGYGWNAAFDCSECLFAKGAESCGRSSRLEHHIGLQ